jgi:hypothetical protein
MSSELEKEFKKFRLEEKPLTSEEPESKSCSCPNITTSLSLLEVSHNKLKVKDKKGLIKPARLKLIGNCYAKRVKGAKDGLSEGNTENKILARNEIEDFTSEAFLKMRISSATAPSTSLAENNNESLNSPSPIEDKLPSTSSSSSLNCSTQAKLQQQLSSTEFDSTIDEMSDFLAYHLSLFNHRDNLIDSMYT